jgi:uncharacterized MnhB-related membrane protein
MERPRFQFDIGIMMIVIAVVAVVATAAFRSVVPVGALAIVAGARFAAHRYVRGRCRAEGREPTEVDRRTIEAIAIRGGSLIAVLYLIAMRVWKEFTW